MTGLSASSVLLFGGSAAASVPWAASVTSPPLIVAGVLVGLVLLVFFVGLLVRTFRSMRSARNLSDVEIVQREADLLLADWDGTPNLETLRRLIDLLKECEHDEERRIASDTLSQVAGRYFGPDDLAWEVWFRRDAQALVARSGRAAHGAEPGAEFLPVS